MFFYEAYGQTLASEFPLDILERCEERRPGWFLRASGLGLLGAVDWYHTIGDGGEVLARYGRAAGSHYLEVAGLGRARIDIERRLIDVCDPVPASKETLCHFVLDQALPLAIAHSRRLVLHASAVARRGLAVAFAGESGAGKSTIAAALCRRGWKLLADDALVFESTIPPRVHAAYPSVRLWEDSAGWFGADTTLLPRVAPGIEKRRVALSGEAGTLELRALYLIRPAQASTGGGALRVPGLGDAIIGLAASSFRLDTGDRKALAHEFELVASLLRVCPVFLIDVCRGFDRVDELIDLVETGFSGR